MPIGGPVRAGSGIADGSRSDGGSGSGRTAGAEARASPGAGPVDPAGRGVAQAGKLDNLGMVQYALREYAAAKQCHEQRWPSAASPCLRTTPISPKV